jgi:hypothetical protein
MCPSVKRKARILYVQLTHLALRSGLWEGGSCSSSSFLWFHCHRYCVFVSACPDKLGLTSLDWLPRIVLHNYFEFREIVIVTIALARQLVYNPLKLFLLWYILRRRQCLDFTAANGWMKHGRWIGKSLQRSGRGLIEVLSKYLPRRSE